MLSDLRLSFIGTLYVHSDSNENEYNKSFDMTTDDKSTIHPVSFSEHWPLTTA